MKVHTRGWRPLVLTSIVALGALAGSTVVSVSSVAADPKGSNGTIKIDGSTIDHGNDNDPHPGCGFTVELFGFDAGATTGSATFDAQAPTKSGSLSFPFSFTAPTRTNGNTLDYTSTYDISPLLATLTPQRNQGYHIKLTVTVVEPNSTVVTKYKVYWVTVCAAASPPVFVAYADTIPNRPPLTGTGLPTPWLGSTNTNFVGTPTGPYDGGVLEITNPTASDITGVHVTVSIASTLYDIWGSGNTIPAHGQLVLAQTESDAFGTHDPLAQFDTSDALSPAGTCASPSTVVPVIHLTINGVTTDHMDTSRVLTTGGVDSALCANNANEAIAFTPTT